MFDDLEVEEICGLLSVFLNDGKECENSCEIIKSTVVKGKIYELIKIIEIYKQQELEFDIDNNLYDYYDINFDFVNMMYMWASGATYLEITKVGNEDGNNNNDHIYEGNFIKLVMKLDNLVQDLIKLNSMYGNIKIIPKLEKIHDIIIRDIVSIQSLYLL